MIRMIAVILFGLVLASSAQAMPLSPIPPLDKVTPVAEGCGAGMHREGRVCVPNRCGAGLRWVGGRCIR